MINSLHWNNRQDWVVPADPPPPHNISYKYKKERKYQVWFSFVTLMAVATSLYFARERGGAPSSTICFHGYGYGFNHGRSHYPAGRLMPLHSLQWFQVHPKAPKKRLKDTKEFCPHPWLRIFFQNKLIQLRGRLDLGIILLESASLSFLSILTFFTSPNTLFSLICEHVRWSSHRLSPGPGLAATHNSSGPCF